MEHLQLHNYILAMFWFSEGLLTFFLLKAFDHTAIYFVR